MQTGSAVLPRAQRNQDPASSGSWFNPSVFKRPSGRGDLGNNCNNAKFTLPGFNNHDLSLFKKFNLRSEKRTLEFRWETFNSFNHTQFNAVGTADLPIVFTSSRAAGSRQPGDWGGLILVGNAESLQRFMDLCAGARQLRRHGAFLIAGGGEVGRKVAELLTDAGEETFLIDTRPGSGVNLVGNVLDTQILKQAGVENVQAVILALNTDSTTLFATVIFKDLAPDVPVIARVNRAENVERIYAAGADFALSISQVSGQLLAWRLLGKESVAVDPELRVIKVSIRGLEKYHPSDSNIRIKTGCTVVAVERGDELVVEFGADFRFEPKDSVYICGSAEAAQKYYEIFPQD